MKVHGNHGVTAARADLKALVVDKGFTAGALGLTAKTVDYPREHALSLRRERVVDAACFWRRSVRVNDCLCGAHSCDSVLPPAAKQVAFCLYDPGIEAGPGGGFVGSTSGGRGD